MFILTLLIHIIVTSCSGVLLLNFVYVMFLDFLIYYECVKFLCFYTFMLYTIATFFWFIFDPYKDLMNVNK